MTKRSAQWPLFPQQQPEAIQGMLIKPNDDLDRQDELGADDEYDDDEICGYGCLECSNTQDHNGRCDHCDSMSLDPIYF